jgi:thiamine-monophosphate kinase
MAGPENTWDDALSLQEVGEAVALAEILPLLPAAPLASLGPGDDAAVLATSDGRVVISCDMMIEGPDFRTDWSTMADVGYKAIASNAADIAAMGATPTGFEIAVAAPAGATLGDVRQLARGFAEGIQAMTPGAGVLGGDLARAPVWTIAVTVIGDLAGRAPVTRSGARPGDILAVSGELGLSHEGLTVLRGAKGAAEIRAALAHPAAQHHLRPTPPIAKGVVAADAGATAMMDISDGLVLDARRMANSSTVSLHLDPGLVWSTHALFGGEDHGLLACFPREESLPPSFRRIGWVRARQDDTAVFLEGTDLQASLGGWDPFAAKDAK